MDTRRTHDLGEHPTRTGSRRSLLAKTFLGAAAGLLPASLLIDSAAAFRSLSGCKDKCDGPRATARPVAAAAARGLQRQQEAL